MKIRNIFLLCLFLLPTLTSNATEAYGGSYTYKLKLYNGEDNVMINTAVTLTTQYETQTVETDSEGFITITIERYGACPSMVIVIKPSESVSTVWVSY